MAEGGQTKSEPSGWTVDTLKQHLDALHTTIQSLQTERDRRYAEVSEERDRRYREVAEEREKALKIKEEADKAALDLARQIQVYKDEKANELREQLASERLGYASKADLSASVERIEQIIKPMATYITQQQGRTGGYSAIWGWFVGAAGVVSAVLVVALR